MEQLYHERENVSNSRCDEGEELHMLIVIIFYNLVSLGLIYGNKPLVGIVIRFQRFYIRNIT